MFTSKHKNVAKSEKGGRKSRSMLTERFYTFALLIDGVHKCIHRIKFDFAPCFGVKSVHMFWIYELQAHPEGLTSAELAGKSMISRSLVSREIERLLENGYVVLREAAHGKRKSYNSRILLTDKGKELAEQIRAEAIKVQNQANDGITEEELVIFYTVLKKFYRNLQKIICEKEGVQKNVKRASLPQRPRNLPKNVAETAKKD